MLPLPPTQSAPTNVLNYTWYCHYAPTRGSTSDALHLLPSLLHPFSLLAHVYFHVHFLSSFPSFNIDRCQLVTPFIIFAFLFSLPPSRNSDPGSQSRLFSPPPHYGSCLAFLTREGLNTFFPRPLASNCGILTLYYRGRSRQLQYSSWCHVRNENLQTEFRTHDILHYQ